MVENTSLWRLLVSDKPAKRSVGGPRRDFECLQRPICEIVGQKLHYYLWT